jgi:prepilin-type N-terminal cleavage/methylation domain-containing protein
MKHSGFSLVEMLMVIGIVGVVSGVTVPLYRDYQVRNDLNIATEQVTQGLARARLLSQTAQEDSGWGFYVPAGVLYKGLTYETRDTIADEIYSMPSTITITGLFEVSYSKVKGAPSATGSITLTALDNETRSILIQVQNQAVAVTQGDNLTVCHKPGTPAEKTMTLSDNAWPGHQGHGDTLGSCAVASAASSTASSTASSVASSTASSTATGGGGGAASSATCTDRFSVGADGAITTTGPLSVIFQSLGAQFGYGNGGPVVPVKVTYQNPTKTSKWINLFGGNAINGTGGATQTVTGFVNGNKVVVRFNAHYSSRGWLTYDNTVTSNDATGSVKILRNGDNAPTIPGANGQQSVSSLLSSVTVNGKINIGQYDVIMLADFNYVSCHTCAGTDFQDGIVWVKFQAPSC